MGGTKRLMAEKKSDINPLKLDFINSSVYGITWFKWLYFGMHVHI